MGNDIQAGAILTALDSAAKKANREVYVVHREGLDIVQNPHITDSVQHDVVWAGPNQVLCINPDVNYRFQSRVANEPVFRTDVHLCEPIEDAPQSREFLSNLFRMNTPIVVAQMVGWFVSCLHKQFYQAAFSQFPLLHPNGSAGSGKTLTTELLGRLYHNTSKPAKYSCSSHASTNFALKGAWTGSASIPLILDEYKPSELGPVRTDYLLQLFRLTYNQGLGASGGMSRGGASSSFRDVTQYAYSAPIAFIGETQETQTAIVQRTLPVSFTQSGKDANTRHFEAAQAASDLMPRLGAALLRKAMAETVESRKATLQPLIAELRSSMDKTVHDRQVYNLAVVLAGLSFLDEVLDLVFGGAFKDDLARLKEAVHKNKAEVAVQAVNEAAKALNDMSLMSRTEDSESEFAMREGTHYIVRDGTIEILMREAFVKYFSWCKRKGFQPLFASSDSFIVAMGKFDAVVDKVCLGSPLKTTGQSRVYRFDLDRLTAEGVEMFATKAG